MTDTSAGVIAYPLIFFVWHWAAYRFVFRSLNSNSRHAPWLAIPPTLISSLLSSERLVTLLNFLFYEITLVILLGVSWLATVIYFAKFLSAKSPFQDDLSHYDPDRPGVVLELTLAAMLTYPVVGPLVCYALSIVVIVVRTIIGNVQKLYEKAIQEAKEGNVVIVAPHMPRAIPIAITIILLMGFSIISISLGNSGSWTYLFLLGLLLFCCSIMGFRGSLILNRSGFFNFRFFLPWFTAWHKIKGFTRQKETRIKIKSEGGGKYFLSQEFVIKSSVLVRLLEGYRKATVQE